MLSQINRANSTSPERFRPKPNKFSETCLRLATELPWNNSGRFHLMDIAENLQTDAGLAVDHGKHPARHHVRPAEPRRRRAGHDLSAGRGGHPRTTIHVRFSRRWREGELIVIHPPHGNGPTWSMSYGIKQDRNRRDAGRRYVRLWAVASLTATQRFGRYGRQSGHGVDTPSRSFMTRRVILRPPITALRKVHSITSAASASCVISGMPGMSALGGGFNWSTQHP